ncbi:hypothetical protein [Rhodococcus sp. MEB064]|uniref:hypothetical protein n=1 Tax=Rhodococcus sp. MEB064 TaxID=1587522 RepID=UPI0018CF1AEA|nr:hypothetical protein [Rhodococcus sp. MEB064]
MRVNAAAGLRPTRDLIVSSEISVAFGLIELVLPSVEIAHIVSNESRAESRYFVDAKCVTERVVRATG